MPLLTPPFYGDIDKKSRDLFKKGFLSKSGLKLDLKTVTNSGIEIKSGGLYGFSTSASKKESASDKNNNFTGDLETKYRLRNYGLTLTEKWNTQNLLATEINVEKSSDEKKNYIPEGLKLGIQSFFTPDSGKKDGRVSFEYKGNYTAIESSADFRSEENYRPEYNGSVVISAVSNWLLGYNFNYIHGEDVPKSNFSLGCITDHYIFNSTGNGSISTTSIWNRSSPRLESGIQVSFPVVRAPKGDSPDTLSPKDRAINYQIAAKYYLDPKTAILAKVNNKSLIGIAYEQRLRALKFGISLQIDGKKFRAGGHQIGFSVEIEP